MQVAIMGAGISGLACALKLEQNGITPVIFEKRSQVGDRFVNGEIFLNLLTTTTGDAYYHLAEEYNIMLKPLSNIKKLILYGSSKKATIEGHLGYCSIRGRAGNALEKQLAKQIKTQILFNSQYTFEELQQNFSHIVVATGDGRDAAKLQLYNKALSVTLKGAIVEGIFNLHTTRAWVDNTFAPKGYGYLIPLSKEKANIVIGIPEYKENLKQDFDRLWQKFYKKVQSDLEQELPITSHFEVNNYLIGECHYPRIGNTYFVGNNLGAIMPFLGFGQFAAILSGIYAAIDISGQVQYEKLVKPIRKSYQNSLVLRRVLEKLDNQKLDKLVEILNGYPGHLLFNSKIEFLKILSYILRPFIKKQTITLNKN